MRPQRVCHDTLDFVSVPGFPSAIRVFALTHSRRIVIQRLPWLISFSLDVCSLTLRPKLPKASATSHPFLESQTSPGHLPSIAIASASVSSLFMRTSTPEFARDGCRIHLKCSSPPPRDQTAFEREKHIDISISVQSAETLSERFTSAGVPFVVPLRQMPYGTEFYVRDPDGYVLGFIESTPTST